MSTWLSDAGTRLARVVRCWWHARQRRRDRRVTWRRLRVHAAAQYPDDSEAAVLLALRVWAAFVQEPGQEHWHCACAEDDPDDPTRRP